MQLRERPRSSPWWEGGGDARGCVCDRSGTGEDEPPSSPGDDSAASWGVAESDSSVPDCFSRMHSDHPPL